ncbi:MAG: response regulator [Deltaproteobacteria bacterium]|nr:MAG: response regulator [Deltaproteobacteria bacterium]
MPGKRILIVEDDEAIRKMEERILDAAGYKVATAGDAEEAWQLLEKEAPPDLCILDVMMPGQSGLELSKEIKAREELKAVPIIFVTARADAESMNEGFKAGGILYLSKPFTSGKLLAMVKAVIGG